MLHRKRKAKKFISDLVKEFNSDGIHYEYRTVFGKDLMKNSTHIVGYLPDGVEIMYCLEPDDHGYMLGHFKDGDKLFPSIISLENGKSITSEEYEELINWCNNHLDPIEYSF